jgi:hypothetical protein
MPTPVKTHEFTLVLTGINLTQKVEDALFEAGCDDATLTRRFGRVYAAFAREAPTRKEAIISAIRDIRKGGGDVLRLDTSELVTQADMAHRIGKSRQLIHQYILGTRGPGGFPPPVTVDLWSWCGAAQWLAQHGFVPKDVYEAAFVDHLINIALEDIHRDTKHRRQMRNIREAIT